MSDYLETDHIECLLVPLFQQIFVFFLKLLRTSFSDHHYQAQTPPPFQVKTQHHQNSPSDLQFQIKETLHRCELDSFLEMLCIASQLYQVYLHS